MNENDKDKNTQYRHRRVQRIKKFLIVSLVISLLCPNVLCFYLLFRVNQMNDTIISMQQLLESAQQEKTIVSQETGAPLNEELVTQEIDNPVEEKFLSDRERFPDSQLIYLTFDDGPSQYTDEILDILEEKGVKATFFVVAKEGYEDQYQRIVSDGHTLGLHSYSHSYQKVYANMDSFSEDITLLSDFLYGITKVRCEFYRFPGGSSNTVAEIDKEEMFAYLREENLTYFDWNVTSKDASSNGLSTTEIVDNVCTGIGDNPESVVLCHDSADKYTTVEALPIIIEKIQNEKENAIFLPITEGTRPICHVISNAVTTNSEE